MINPHIDFNTFPKPLLNLVILLTIRPKSFQPTGKIHAKTKFKSVRLYPNCWVWQKAKHIQLVRTWMRALNIVTTFTMEYLVHLLYLATISSNVGLTCIAPFREKKQWRRFSKIFYFSKNSSNNSVCKISIIHVGLICWIEPKSFNSAATKREKLSQNLTCVHLLAKRLTFE